MFFFSEGGGDVYFYFLRGKERMICGFYFFEGRGRG